jgi:hypothetical protein
VNGAPMNIRLRFIRTDDAASPRRDRWKRFSSVMLLRRDKGFQPVHPGWPCCCICDPCRL